ncbi:hypothetical protein OBJ95_05895 [Empedobacter falsenii]
MDTVRGRRTIRVTKKGDTLSASLIANKPLVAKYQDNQVIGSWADIANNRIVYAQILTSLSNTPVATASISNIVWKFNGAVISDSDAKFEKTVYNIGSIQVPALKIKADIMNGITTTSSIEFSADVYTGGYTTKINCFISVIRENVSANTYSAYIIDKDGRGATITSQFPTVNLEAVLEKGGVILSTGLTYQWFRMTLDSVKDLANDTLADNRETLVGKTGKILSLTKKDVDTYDTFMVDIKENGQFVKSAIISVRDETDALDLQYNITGSESDLNVGGSVKYTPEVVLHGTTTPAPGTWTFSYQKIKTDGTLVGTKSTGTSYTITYAEVESAGGEIDVLFEATEA